MLGNVMNWNQILKFKEDNYEVALLCICNHCFHVDTLYNSIHSQRISHEIFYECQM